MPLTIPGVHVDRRVHSHVLQEPLAAPRAGVMLHYDDSSDDEASLAWFQDPRCSNGYTWLVLDDGQLIELADPGLRTPHAGPCLTPMANSVYYGIAASTNGIVPATPAQVNRIVQLCEALFRYHRWPASDAHQRIVGHDAQAIWTPEQTRLAGIPDAKARFLWGRLGRKVDPTGQRHDGRKILDLEEVRAMLRVQLIGGGGARAEVYHAA
jgi:N-acetyl-anhydromuramyl-L-alanine amidase AmpD